MYLHSYHARLVSRDFRLKTLTVPRGQTNQLKVEVCSSLDGIYGSQQGGVMHQGRKHTENANVCISIPITLAWSVATSD
jgi:hypothetical protein